MTQATKTRQKIVTFASVALVVALAIGWYVDRTRIENRLYAVGATLDLAKDKAKKAIADRADAEKELKLTKQALIDADETRLIIGQRAQDCEKKLLDTIGKLDKCEAR